MRKARVTIGLPDEAVALVVAQDVKLRGCVGPVAEWVADGDRMYESQWPLDRLSRHYDKVHTELLLLPPMFLRVKAK